MKSAFGQALITVCIILLAALLLIGFSFQLLVRNYIIANTFDNLRSDAQVIADLTAAYNDDLPSSKRDYHVALTAAAAVSGADAVICDAQGKLLMCAKAPMGCAHQGMILSGDYLRRALETGGCTSTGIIEGLYEEPRYIVSTPIALESGAVIGLVIVSAPVDLSLQILSRISDTLIFVSVTAAIIAVICMAIFARRQSRPLREMARAASDFGHGKLSARVSTSGRYSREVEELALAFNNMASSLQKSEQQRQEFVTNISHELKTPMTTISGYIDGILDGTIPEENSRQCLLLVSDETKRLSRLVRNMLDISRLQEQGGIPEDQLTAFDLSEQAGQVLVSFERKINEKQQDVTVELPEHPVTVRGCADQITQVIYNLVDNAIKFCPQGGELSLSITETEDKAYFSITNDGKTIPPEELPLVFDRFHKLDKSRSVNRDSWGLGLHIVKTIIGLHGENLSVTSRDGKTTFTFTMPLVR